MQSSGHNKIQQDQTEEVECAHRPRGTRSSTKNCTRRNSRGYQGGYQRDEPKARHPHLLRPHHNEAIYLRKTGIAYLKEKEEEEEMNEKVKEKQKMCVCKHVCFCSYYHV